MDHIVTLDSRQVAALQDIADSFIAQHKGDAVMCTHGDLVPELLRLASRDGLAVEDAPRWPKGSTWVLESDGSQFTRARYLAPPEP